MPDKGASDGKQRRDFSQRKLNRANNQANGRITKQSAERTTRLDRASKTQEEAGALEKN